MRYSAVFIIIQLVVIKIKECVRVLVGFDMLKKQHAGNFLARIRPKRQAQVMRQRSTPTRFFY